MEINLRTLTFNGLSHVIVDDQRHVLDVDTTPSHVRGHQNVLGSTLETGQGKLSLFLTLPSVQGTGIVLNKKRQGNECWERKKNGKLIYRISLLSRYIMHKNVFFSSVIGEPQLHITNTYN